MDLFVFNALHGIAGKWRFLDWLLVFTGKFLPYIAVLAAVIFIFKIGDWKNRWFVFAESALAIIGGWGIINRIIQYIYHRPQPFVNFSFEPVFSHKITASFPSDHATVLAALATVFLFYNRKLGYSLLGVSVIVGLARIASGLHWPSDVLAGLLIGSALALVSHFILKPFKQSEIKNGN